MHGKCRGTNERLDGLVAMKIEGLRHRRTEQGRLCGSCWRSLCIICRWCSSQACGLCSYCRNKEWSRAWLAIRRSDIRKNCR